MELTLLAIGVIVFVFVVGFIGKGRSQTVTQPHAPYIYSRKDTIMTQTEINFYKRLEMIAGDRYYIFPQIHLTALAKNETRGRYYKLGYQRINRRSVDYVLCDKVSLQPVYAVELDDRTHDTTRRQARDQIVETILTEIGLPLVRFRNTGSLTDEDIAKSFYDAHRASDYGMHSQPDLSVS